MNKSRTLSSDVVILVAALGAAALLGVLAGGIGSAVLVLPILLVGAVVLFARPAIGLFLIAATIPLEAALMVGGRSVAALIGMGVFGVWAIQKLLRRESLLPLASSRLVQVAILLWAFAALSFIWAHDPGTMQQPLVLLAQLVVLLILVTDLTSSWERIAWVLKLLVLAATVASVLTIEQYFVGGARRAGEGVVGGLNRTAITLITILPFAFYLLRSREHVVWRWLGLGYIGLSAVAVSVTFSRMNFLLFPVVVAIHLALMAKTRSGRRGVMLLASITIVVVSFMPLDAVRQRAETISPYLSQTVRAQDSGEPYSTRGYLMRLGLEMFKDRPLIGSGFDNYQALANAYQWRVPRSPYEYLRQRPSPESSHLGIAVGLGIVGLSMWIGFFVIAAVYMWRAWKVMPSAAHDGILMVEAVGVAVLLQVAYGLYDEIHQAKMVWILLGLAGAIHALVRSRTPGEPRQGWTSPHVGGHRKTSALRSRTRVPPSGRSAGEMIPSRPQQS